MSELLSVEATLTRMNVPSLTFSLIQLVQVAKVAYHVGGLVDFLDLSRLLFPTYLVEDATIGNDLSLENVVDSFDL